MQWVTQCYRWFRKPLTLVIFGQMTEIIVPPLTVKRKSFVPSLPTYDTYAKWLCSQIYGQTDVDKQRIMVFRDDGWNGQLKKIARKMKIILLRMEIFKLGTVPSLGWRNHYKKKTAAFPFARRLGFNELEETHLCELLCLSQSMHRRSWESQLLRDRSPKQ